MSDFSLTSLFVGTTTGTTAQPTTGTTADLDPAQIGVFLPDNTPASVATVGNAKYIYIAQGRNIYSVNQGTKKSDQIYTKNVIEWYKVTGSMTASTQITEVTNLSLNCQQDFSVTFRLDSFYIRAAYRNSLTRTVMVTAPCCSCGANPCDTLTAVEYATVLQSLAYAINADSILGQFVTASIGNPDGSGNAQSLYIVGKTLQQYGQGTSADLTNFPYQFDRMFFWTYLMEGPDLTTDYEVQNYCNNVGTVNILQRASYPQCTPAEVQQLEKDFWSYQSEYKHIFSNVNYNGEFQTYVDQTISAYNLYYIRFFEPQVTGRDIGVTRKDETVCLAVVGGGAVESNIVPILSAFLGSPDNQTATSSTTTSLTSTLTSSSTTTTYNTTP
jgi:hypothetical protein